MTACIHPRHNTKYNAHGWTVGHYFSFYKQAEGKHNWAIIQNLTLSTEWPPLILLKFSSSVLSKPHLHLATIKTQAFIYFTERAPKYVTYAYRHICKVHIFVLCHTYFQSSSHSLNMKLSIIFPKNFNTPNSRLGFEGKDTNIIILTELHNIPVCNKYTYYI